MQSILFAIGAPGAHPLGAAILDACARPVRLVGIVDGLVSVTQRAWGLVPSAIATERALH